VAKERLREVARRRLQRTLPEEFCVWIFRLCTLEEYPPLEETA
jgi:hypothetical protein